MFNALSPMIEISMNFHRMSLGGAPLIVPNNVSSCRVPLQLKSLWSSKPFNWFEFRTSKSERFDHLPSLQSLKLSIWKMLILTLSGGVSLFRVSVELLPNATPRIEATWKFQTLTKQPEHSKIPGRWLALMKIAPENAPVRSFNLNVGYALPRVIRSLSDLSIGQHVPFSMDCCKQTGKWEILIEHPHRESSNWKASNRSTSEIKRIRR